MKPLFIVLTALSSLFMSSAKANETEVSAVVLKSFQSTFASAKEANWSEVENNLYKVYFILNEQYITAFYRADGELVAVTRNLSTTQLPVVLQTELKKEYSEYWISDVFELSNEQGVQYFVTVENADSKILLRSSNSVFSTYQKIRKS